VASWWAGQGELSAGQIIVIMFTSFPGVRRSTPAKIVPPGAS